MSENEKPTAAFVLSLVAGLFVIIGGGLMSLIGAYWPGIGTGRFGGMMMPSRAGMMSGLGMVGGLFGIIIGALIVASALMMERKPQEHTTWGTLIVILSVLSIFGGMGGLGIGLLLGLIGGVLAIVWHPTPPQTPQTKA